MDVRWLEDFLAVASTGNFTRAAELRGVSQAAFSRRIKTLESWLRTTLIDRATNPARLTRDGELFREQAAEILQQIAEARRSIVDSGTVRRKQIRVALVYSLASGAFPAWWTDWAAKIGPEVVCSIVSGNSPDSIAALMTGGVDLLVCHQSKQSTIALSPEQYDQVSIGQDTIAPYAAPALACAGEDLLLGQRSATTPLLMYTRKSSFAHVVERIIEEAPHKLAGRVAFKAETSSVLRAMAIAGHGVAWLPESAAREAPACALQRVGREGWSATLDIVAYRDKRAGFAALERLWSLLGSHHA